MLRWIRLGWEWWGEHWLRVQAIATPIGSLLATLWLSQAGDVGWWWNSQAEYKVAAEFASAGILFYTASIAALEAGVWLMVLGLQLYRKFEQDRAKRRQELMGIGAELALEAQRISKETGKPYEEILQNLIAKETHPAQS